MRRIARTLSPVFLLATCAVASAHPGHGTTDPASAVHQIVEPVHAIPWLLVVAIGVTLTGTAAALWRNRRRRSPAVASRRRQR